MSKVNAEIIFQNDFNGKILNKNNDVIIGENGLAPYDMLQGALAACLHATFLSILIKKRLIIDSARYIINGDKKEEIPTTLTNVNIEVYIRSGDNAQQIIKSFDLATKYCSIYNTIAHVATMSYQVHFEE